MPRRTVMQIHINGNIFHRNNLNNNDRYPFIHMRDHLFYTAFLKIAMIYSRIFSSKERKYIEFFILFLALLSLVLLMYIHVAFVQRPANCLMHMQGKWPRDGILRVEILQEKLDGKYSLEKSYMKEKKIHELEYENFASLFFARGIYDDDDYSPFMDSSDYTTLVNHSTSDQHDKNSSLYNSSLNEWNSENAPLPTLTWTDDEYIMEFSLEYGFLKLSPSVRKQKNISVELVTLDPNEDSCFGGSINRFILYYFLGFDEVLLASLKLLAAKENYRGYVRNVVTDVEYIFVNGLMDSKSYITAGFVMLVFTSSISILLRYSHHQIFIFIVELLHMVEFHSSFNFPFGPLLTVILALVGMEAIMSEFFSDTAIAFYVILIVWFADQFDTICCHSYFTKKYWLRFFYLYHFSFYAYSYRFGHNRFNALYTSWLFILHSMLFFFHRYELPLLIEQFNRQQNNNTISNNNQENPPEDPDSPASNGSDRSNDTLQNQTESSGNSSSSNQSSEDTNHSINESSNGSSNLESNNLAFNTFSYFENPATLNLFNERLKYIEINETPRYSFALHNGGNFSVLNCFSLLKTQKLKILVDFLNCSILELYFYFICCFKYIFKHIAVKYLLILFLLTAAVNMFCSFLLSYSSLFVIVSSILSLTCIHSYLNI